MDNKGADDLQLTLVKQSLEKNLRTKPKQNKGYQYNVNCLTAKIDHILVKEKVVCPRH